MKLRLITAAIIFVGSYFPLSLILLAQNFDFKCIYRWHLTSPRCVVPFKNPYFSTGIFFTCLVCLLITFFTLRVVKGRPLINIRESKYIPSELMNYVLPYVVSFMSIDYQDSSKFIGFTIFLAWMFWLTYQSGQIILNPILTAFGWRLYEVKYNFPGNNQEHSGTVLSNSEIMPGEQYAHTAIQDVLLVKRALLKGT